MQFKRGEALATCNRRMLDWCQHYTKVMREIEHTKFNEITAFILEYMDVHTKLTPDEVRAQQQNARAN